MDTPQPSHHTINAQDGSKVAEVTYAAMSKARDATVQVKFRLKDGHNASGIRGEISALIDGFEDKYRSAFFKCAMPTMTLSRAKDDDSWFLLELLRNVVAVPYDSRVLHIEVDLQIETEDGNKVEVKASLHFLNGICGEVPLSYGNIEIKLGITWSPEHHPTVAYTIGDELSFTGFIMAIRRTLAKHRKHRDNEDIFDRHHNFYHLFSKEHPVLAKQRAEQPVRWIHITLQAVNEKGTFWTTLLMRGDNLHVSGFITQQGAVYELIVNQDSSAHILPIDDYDPQRLCWGVDYKSLLDADTEHDLLGRLARLKMGREFAMDAVRVLSGFPGWVNGDLNPRVALAGLMFMARESARMNRVNTFFALQWNNNECFDYHELRDYVFNYRRSSQQLLMWKSKGYDNPCPMVQLLDTYLVLNCRLNPPETSSMGRGGQPRVELLAMRADFGVVGTTVIVFDGKQGQIIYTKEEQDEKGIMTDLVLAGPYTSISAAGCFAIEIDIPLRTDAGSSSGDSDDFIKWEWNCYNPKYAKQVDTGPKTQIISSSGPGQNVEVTYAVMSNALEATVQVKLRMKDGNSPCSVHGLINARIGDFKHQSILFKRTQETAQHFSPMTDSTRVVRYQLVRSLKLDRNVVAVPCGQMLHIEMHLNIETSKNQEVSKSTRFDETLSFGNGTWSKRCEVDDVTEVEVNVAWYPDSSDSSERCPTFLTTKEIEEYDTTLIKKEGQRQPDISYKVGEDAQGFSTFITELRRLVAEQPYCKDLMADHPQFSSPCNHPVLRKGRGILTTEPIESERLFHIKLEAAVEGVEASSISLVMRDDTLDILGFINMNGDCYELCYDDKTMVLPLDYGSKSLPWKQDDIFPEKSTKLGKTFAADAIGLLSRYEEGERRREYREALVVLKVMVRDSARIEPVFNTIVEHWDSGAQLTKQLKDYRRYWPEISRALLDWKDHAYEGWPQNEELEKIRIMNPEDALKVAPLVFNDKERIFKSSSYVVDLT